MKVIYAKEGEAVQDVMLDHGALAVLSLDDVMAVRIERETTLDVGDTVCVTLADGTEVDGRVKTNLEGVLTVTVDDDDYAVGVKVTVSTEDGDRLGSGELYIFSPWSATAYSGTVDDILVEENDTVAIGRSLFSLENTGSSAQFQRLIDQRQEYEQLMQELFTMYRTETITAPCDGIVTGVDEDGAYLLTEDGDGWFADLLSIISKDAGDGFIAYAVQVTEVTDQGTTLQIDPQLICIEDMAALSTVSADLTSMTKEWHYSGKINIYTQNTDGVLCNAGTAKAGDVLLAVGDEEQARWFVVLHGSGETAQMTQTANKNSGIFAFLLSEEESISETPSCDGVTCTMDVEEEGHVAGCSKIVQVFSDVPERICNGASRCTLDADAEGHQPRCENYVESTPELSIITSALSTGVAGQPYTYPMQVSGSSGGTWLGENLPAGLALNEQTGVISGTPAYEGTFTVKVTYTDTATNMAVSQEYTLKVVTAETVVCTGYVAQIVEINDGWAKVKQTLYSYTIADLANPPKVSASATDLTVEKEYTSDLIKASELAVGDTCLIVVNNKGTVKLISKEAVQESQGTPGQQDGTNTGSTPSGGGTASAGGGGMADGGAGKAFETYSLDKLTVASVTSQEHMTVSITIDELDITKIYVGQSAIVSVDALGGEQFEAEITRISNSGENEGGNTKFTVEVSLGKSGEMLPGMYSSAFITLETDENVPCVPVAALGKNGVNSVLYTSYDAEDNILGDPVVVTIGASDGENVEILDGFTAGQTCYYEYYDTYVGSDTPRQQGRSINLGRILGGR